MRFTLNILAIAAISVSCLFLSPKNLFAQSSSGTPPSTCFKQEECTGSGYNGIPLLSGECAGSGDYKYICSAKPPSVKLSVPFGGATEITGLGNYIGTLYKFLIGSAGILAGIMIVIAGFEWLTAAGDSGKIKHARERITNALIGLVLALGSYTILYTVNPALISLQFAPVKMVRKEDLSSLNIKRWEACDPNNEEHQKKCAAGCPGCKCIAFNQVAPECGFIQTGSNIVLGAATVASFAIPIPGLQINAMQGLWSAGKFIWKIPLVGSSAAVTGAYYGGKWTYEQISGPDAQLNGRCVDTKEDVFTQQPVGSPCNADQECASRNCKSFKRCSIFGGVCVDLKLRSPCDPDGKACVEGTCIEVKIPGSYSIYQCSDSSWGGTCNPESGCGAGLKCSRTAVCIKEDAPLPNNAPCRSNYDCVEDRTYSVTGDVQQNGGWLTPAQCLFPNGQFRNDQTRTGDLPDGVCTSGERGSKCSRTAQSPCKNSTTTTCLELQTTAGTTTSYCALKSSLDEPCTDTNDCGGGLACVPAAGTARQGVEMDYHGIQIIPKGNCYRSSQQPCSVPDECASGRCTGGRCET